MLESTILAIDLGGTKTSAALFRGPEMLSRTKISTMTGVSGVQNTVSALLAYFETVPDAVCVACPGKFDQNTYIVESGSAQNLNSTEGEFDGISIYEVFRQVVPKESELRVMNDGIAQFLGGIYQCIEQKSGFVNRKVGYLGIGTGLGGGFGFVDELGQVTLYSNGHVSDMKMPEKEGSMEDWVSGRALASEHTTLDEMSLDLVRIMTCLYEGKQAWMQASDAWDELAINQVKGTRDFLVGGGLGKQLFPVETPFNLHLIEDPETAALLGCWSFFFQSSQR